MSHGEIPLPVLGTTSSALSGGVTRGPRPDWLRVRLPSGPNWARLRGLLRSKSLHTVCEEARCPNLAECWGEGTATFMILGDVCTRSCRFCAVTSGRPTGLDLEEPERVAEAVEAMGLRHAVITSVNRDDLGDGGARIFAETIRAVRRRMPETTVETLIPDFRGDRKALGIVMAAAPEILNHNVETVPRLYRRVRPGARYRWSLGILEEAKRLRPDALTKTGVMLGLGETADELDALMEDLVASGVDILTAGQYLRPTPNHLPVERYVPPAEFDDLAARGRAIGLRHVEAGPLVRSSYHAANQVPGDARSAASQSIQPVDKVTRHSSGDASRLNAPLRCAPGRSSLRIGRNTPGIPPSRAAPTGRTGSAGRRPAPTGRTGRENWATLGAHATSSTD